MQWPSQTSGFGYLPEHTIPTANPRWLRTKYIRAWNRKGAVLCFPQAEPLHVKYQNNGKPEWVQQLKGYWKGLQVELCNRHTTNFFSGVWLGEEVLLLAVPTLSFVCDWRADQVRQLHQKWPHWSSPGWKGSAYLLLLPGCQFKFPVL